MSRKFPGWTKERVRDYQRGMKSPMSGAEGATSPLPARLSPRSAPSGLNKTEAEYLLILTALLQAGEIDHIFGHEDIKFRVGEERCWYSVDFAVLRNGYLELHEVKGGFVRDDARVKFQAAKKQYPQFVWIWAQKKKGAWTVT